MLAAIAADDATANLKKALVKGPSLGVHFMFVASGLAHFPSGLISLFKHRVVFACPASDAEKVLRDPSVEIPNDTFRLSVDGDEVTMKSYII